MTASRPPRVARAGPLRLLPALLPLLDGGHTLDFVNKACELLDLIGWEAVASLALKSFGTSMVK